MYENVVKNGGRINSEWRIKLSIENMEI